MRLSWLLPEMFMLRRMLLLLSFASTAGLAATSLAEPVYTYVPQTSSYTAAPGQSVQVHLYLQESLANGDSSIINSNGGLFGAGFAVTVAAGQINTGTLTAISGDTTNFSGGLLTDPNNTTSKVRADEYISLTDTSGPMTTMNLISLGYVTVSASSVAGTTTTFQVGAYNPGGGGYTQSYSTSPFYDLDITNGGSSGSVPYIGAGGTLDNPIAYNSTFTLTSVAPEPVSCAAVVCGSLLAIRPSRRRKAKVT